MPRDAIAVRAGETARDPDPGVSKGESSLETQKVEAEMSSSADATAPLLVSNE